MTLEERKESLIEYWIANEILKDKKIIEAFRKVSREDFLPPDLKEYAYADEPLPIMSGQTISQPTTVAIMTQALEPRRGQKILEIGAGSGYQAALIAEIVGPKGKLFTIEILEDLYEYAKKNLNRYENVTVLLGDGSHGYEKEAPFDRIIVTAAGSKVPEKLFEQLKEQGILLIPVGNYLNQSMLKIRKHKGEKLISNLGQFVFVPLRGDY